MSTGPLDGGSSRDDMAPPLGASAPKTRRRSLSRTKRVGFAVVAMILSWLLCELAGYLLFWLWLGRPFSWAEAQNQRRDRANRPQAVTSNVFSDVHPYVGYVEEPRKNSGVRRTRDGRLLPVSEFGYIDDKDPIQARGPDRVVVAILGGSVACYFAVNGTDRLEAELSASPAYAGRAFRVRQPGTRRVQAAPAGS